MFEFFIVSKENTFSLQTYAYERLMSFGGMMIKFS